MKKAMKLVWIGLSFVGWISLANAGTYNFYINNTEQGDNSTSTPTVTVKDGKNGEVEVEKTGGDQDSAKKNPNLNPNEYPASEPATAPQASSNSNTSFAHTVKSSQKSPFRLTGGVGTATIYENKAVDFMDADLSSGVPPWDQKVSSTGSQSVYEISGEYYPSPVFGMGLVFGKLSGVEAMVAPLGNSGSIFQPELMVGYLGTKSGFGGEADPFVGARLNLLVQESLALTATIRKSIETNPDLRYTQMVAGVSLRF